MDLQLNADRFSGQEYINIYDQVRPTPPTEIIHQALNYLNKSIATSILDIGCGTGISTLVWKDFSDRIVGLDPSTEMIELAKKKLADLSNFKFITGFSHEIPLPSQSIELITCSQSFHWMGPVSTLTEISRILTKDGVLVIYDVIWPPSVNDQFELAYNALFAKIGKLTAQLNEPVAHIWDKKNHLTNVVSSNLFKFVREGYYHKTDPFDLHKFIGIALSQGGLEALLKRGYSNQEIGIDQFIENLDRLNNPHYPGITYNYRVIFAKKIT